MTMDKCSNRPKLNKDQNQEFYFILFYLICFFNKLKNGEFKNVVFMIILSPNVCFHHASYSVTILQKAFMNEGICRCTDRITTA
jgi:hypothetical protein